jgi:recA bacterial DNA recombination protein
MKSTAISRLEDLLKHRKLDGAIAPSWRTDPGLRVLPTGLPALDEALGGGWRRGEMSELIGERSTGRTSVLVSTMAAATRRGDLVGLVDVVDRFDPGAAAAAGLDLDRVLWVRGPSLTVEMARPSLLDKAVHRAVRALDLLIRAGGFAVVAFDAADVPPRALRALPWTTWMRLARANEGRESVCLLVGQAAMGRSARGASVRLEAAIRWTGTSVQSRRLAGLEVRATAGPGRHGLLSFRTAEPERVGAPEPDHVLLPAS